MSERIRSAVDEMIRKANQDNCERLFAEERELDITDTHTKCHICGDWTPRPHTGRPRKYCHKCNDAAHKNVNRRNMAKIQERVTEEIARGEFDVLRKIRDLRGITTTRACEEMGLSLSWWLRISKTIRLRGRACTAISNRDRVLAWIARHEITDTHIIIQRYDFGMTSQEVKHYRKEEL